MADKLGRKEFGQLIKQKYPEYKDLGDIDVADRVLENYPVYRERVKRGFMPELQQDIRGTVQNVKSTFGRAGEKRQEALRAGVAGEQTGAESVFQFAGETIGGAFGALGDVAIGAGKALLPQRAEDVIGGAVNRVVGSQPVQNVMDRIRQFQQNNPRAGRNVSALLGFAEPGLEVIGAGAGVRAARVGARGARQTARTARQIGGGLVDVTGDVAEFGVSQATGLNPNTLKQIIGNPENFTQEARQALDRASLSSKFNESLQRTFREFEGLGAEYGPIRQLDVSVAVPSTFLDDTLRQLKLDVENGKIIANRSSITRDPNDIGAIQRLYDNWSGVEELTPEEFLNFRSDLSDLANFDRASGKTQASERVAQAIRADLNTYRDQIPGLSELDARFSEDVKLVNQLKKDLIDVRTGELKDNALNKLANATGRGKDQFLDRLRQVDPEIEQRIEILRALEDIEYAQGQKVGTYVRSALGGGAVVAGASGAIGVAPALGLLLLSNPKTITNFFVWYGRNINPSVQSVVESAVKKIEQGKKLLDTENQVIQTIMQSPSFIVNSYIDTLGATAGLGLSAEIPAQEAE